MDVFSDAEQSAQLVSEIVVPDLRQTLDFLLALGFQIERRTGDFAVLRWDSSLLFIAQNANATVEHRWLNVRVMVTDVDAVWSKVNGLGAKILNPIGDRHYGLRDFVVAGPGAVEIRFAQALRVPQ